MARSERKEHAEYKNEIERRIKIIESMEQGVANSIVNRQKDKAIKLTPEQLVNARNQRVMTATEQLQPKYDLILEPYVEDYERLQKLSAILSTYKKSGPGSFLTILAEFDETINKGEYGLVENVFSRERKKIENQENEKMELQVEVLKKNCDFMKVHIEKMPEEKRKEAKISAMYNSLLGLIETLNKVLPVKAKLEEFKNKAASFWATLVSDKNLGRDMSKDKESEVSALFTVSTVSKDEDRVSLPLAKQVSEGLWRELKLLTSKYGLKLSINKDGVIDSGNYKTTDKDNLASIYVKQAYQKLAELISSLKNPTMKPEDLAVSLQSLKLQLEALKGAIKFSKQRVSPQQKDLVTQTRGLFYKHISHQKPGAIITGLIAKVNEAASDAQINKAETVRRVSSTRRMS